ncbi:tRNA-queuosine alpha-mannosyltransferase isoform X2 [Ambystoma mexicanum]|uniref:tRNA-queuosine alpha-mannosyltransferase isoform X2 n=1 Tax=Ambystoma mexicanum TaxID=8296 RepID=UPI0037E7D2DC
MDILIIEAFYGGSHKQLVDLLHEEFKNCVVFSLPAKKWHWRARTAALHFMQSIEASDQYGTLFTSSVLNLAELVALRPDLGKLRKVLYFHENQLVYPVRKSQERDFQYGYNQVLSCLVADVVVFNSRYNMESFLTSINGFMRLIPDHRPTKLEGLIRPKCQVLHFPIRFPDVNKFIMPRCKHVQFQNRTAVDGHTGLFGLSTSDTGITDLTANSYLDKEPTFCPSQEEMPESLLQNSVEVDTSDASERTILDHEHDHKCITPYSILSATEEEQRPLHIVWPHRWEHDKDPETLFQVLLKLKSIHLSFHVSVLGETFTDVPGWRPCTVVATHYVPKLWCIQKSSQLSTSIQQQSSFQRNFRIFARDQI